MVEAEAFIRRRLQELFGLEARKLPEGVAPTADFDDEPMVGVLGNDNGTERVGNAINKGPGNCVAANAVNATRRVCAFCRAVVRRRVLAL
jgi:hypothetical protein